MCYGDYLEAVAWLLDRPFQIVLGLHRARSQILEYFDLALADFDVRSIARKPYFVPETTTLDEQMRQFLRMRSHFALVVDEYGTLEGLITLEDILEEIVGEIVDEFDPEADHVVRRTPEGDYLVDGAMTIRAVGAVCRAAKGLCPARCSQSEKGIAVNSDSSTGENASQQ